MVAQRVYFIRHGEGYHNIGVVNEDAHLTDMGWRQAEALRQHLGNIRPPPDIQVFLFRCIPFNLTPFPPSLLLPTPAC